ncbi:MAG: amidohydrolase family protein [Deltaproteobacteria bacterium]|nr:amidohydrolase family protein [Deltaproteobacteria bacterium]
MIIRNGTVWLENGPRQCDIRVADGKIAEVGNGLTNGGEDVVDVSGLDVLPGLVDMHVHVSDTAGRFCVADTFHTGSYAAVQSGITTFVTFVTQNAGEMLDDAVARMARLADGKSYCDYAFHVTPTQFGPGTFSAIEALAARGFKTLKLYTTYKEAGLYVDYDLIREVMVRASSLKTTVLVHCEDQETLDAVSPGPEETGSAAAHCRLRPPQAEAVAIQKIIELAAETRCRTHIVHVSTEKGLVLIDKSRPSGGLTCETAPQYLLYNDSILSGDGGHRFLCTPPFRGEHDRAGLEAASLVGVFDVFATDHCPFTRADKDSWNGDVRTVPSGVAGVGALFPLTHEIVVKKHGRSLGEVVRLLAAGPARVAGLYPAKGTIRPGSDADLVIVDQNGPPRPIISSIADCYETWPDRTTTLDFKFVFLRGEMVIKDNKFARPDAATGRLAQG